MGCGHLDILKSLSGVHEIKALFVITLRRYFYFSCIDICTDGVKAVIGKTSDAPAHTKLGVSAILGSHVVFFSPPLTCTKNNNSLKYVLDKALKIMSALKIFTLEYSSF